MLGRIVGGSLVFSGFCSGGWGHGWILKEGLYQSVTTSSLHLRASYDDQRSKIRSNVQGRSSLGCSIFALKRLKCIGSGNRKVFREWPVCLYTLSNPSITITITHKVGDSLRLYEMSDDVAGLHRPVRPSECHGSVTGHHTGTSRWNGSF